MSAILWANIGNVYYGVAEEEAHEISSRREMFQGVFCIKGQTKVNLKQIGYRMCRDVLDEYKAMWDRRATRSKMDIRFMQEAIAEARKGMTKGHGGPFGAVIVHDGKIIARGHNRVVIENNPTRHGEMVAIRNAAHKVGQFDLTYCDLYTTGEPCPMCLAAIKWLRIANVYYGCTLQDNESIGFRDDVFNKALSVDRAKLTFNMKQLGRAECLELFEEYRNMKNKTLY